MIWLSWRKKKMRVSLNYNGRTRQPSLSDLMPLTDNSDPLYITRGNPDLKQMFMHTMHVSFNILQREYPPIWDGRWRRTVSHKLFSMMCRPVDGDIPININGNWNTYGQSDWWKRFGHFSLKLSTSGRHSNRVSMINEDRSQQPEKSTTRDTGLNCEMAASYQPTWGGFDFSTSWDYQYSLNSLNDNNTYTRYYNFRFDGYVDFPFGFSCVRMQAISCVAGQISRKERG